MSVVKDDTQLQVISGFLNISTEAVTFNLCDIFLDYNTLPQSVSLRDSGVSQGGKKVGRYAIFKYTFQFETHACRAEDRKTHK